MGPPPPPPMPHGMVSQPTTPAVWSSPAKTSSTRPALSAAHQLSTSLPATVLSSTAPTPSLVSTAPHPMSTSSSSSHRPRMPMETSTTPPAGMPQSHALTPALTTPDLCSWRTSTTTATPRTATTTTVRNGPPRTSPPTSVWFPLRPTSGATHTPTMDHSPSPLVMPFSVNFSRSPLSNNQATPVSSQCGHHPSPTKLLNPLPKRLSLCLLHLLLLTHSILY